MPMRKYTPGATHWNSASEMNGPMDDAIAAAGYAADRSDFAGFARTDPVAPMRWSGGPFYDATHPTFGAKGDGSQDDRTALFNANAAAAQSGILQLWPGAGYHVDSNLTIDSHTLRAIPGAKLQPNAGVTITIACTHLDARSGLFDRSRGGSFVFTKIKEFDPVWFGIQGDAATNDAPALNWMRNQLPTGAVVVFRNNLAMRLGDGTGGTLYDNTVTYTAGQRVAYGASTYQCIATSTGNTPPNATFWTLVDPNTVTRGMWLMALGQTDITYSCTGFPGDAYYGDNRPRFIWAGPPGGTMIGSFNSGNISLLGFFLDAQSAFGGVEQDQFTIGSTNGSAAITVNAANSGGTGDGAQWLNQIPLGTALRISQAGPGFTELDTTLAAYGVDGAHATLAAAASETLSNNAISVGQSAPAPNGRISTQCVYFRNKILGGTGVTSFVGLRISYTSKANCEFNIITENNISGNAQFTQTFPIPQNGNSYGRGDFNGDPIVSVSAPGGSIAAGSNAFGGFTVDTFSPPMNGARIRIAGAGARSLGPNLSHAALDGYMKYVDARNCLVYSDAGLTTPLNAVDGSSPAYSAGTTYYPGDMVSSGGVIYACLATTTGNAPPNATYWTSIQGPHFYVGQSLGTGIWIGPSFNAHKQIVNRNQLNFLTIGFRSDGGSFECYNNFMTDNECDHLIGNQQAIPSSITGDVSEDSRQWLVTESEDGLELSSCRMSAERCTPSDGFVKVLQNAGGQLTVKNSVIGGGGTTAPDTAAWNLSAAAGQPVFDEKNIYPNQTTLAQIGWQELPLNCIVEMKGSRANNATGLLPYEATYVSTQTRLNGAPVRYVGSTLIVQSGDHAPDSSLFTGPSQWTMWADYVGWHMRGTLKNGVLVDNILATKNAQDVETGTSFQPDLSVTLDFWYKVNGASPSVNYTLNGNQGDEVVITIENTTASAIATSWHATYAFPPTKPWVDPAPGKLKSARFKRYASGTGNYQLCVAMSDDLPGQ